MLTPLLAVALTQLSPRPNIIVVFSDDHARSAISAYGSRTAQTPGIDRLAHEGAIFRRHYTSNPICAPSRATLLTGKLSHKNGHRDNAATFDGSQPTLPKLLRQADYESAFIGKWHLVSKPTGFDHWEVLPGQGDYYHPRFITERGQHVESGYVTDLITKKALKWIREKRAGPFFLVVGHKAPHRPWVPNASQLTSAVKHYPEPVTLRTNHEGLCSAARTVTMSIEKDLTQAVDLTVGVAPGRLTPAEQTEWLARSGPADRAYLDRISTGSDLLGANYQRYMRQYLAAAQWVDTSVSEILQELDRSGRSKDTIVIYASDQGFFLGENGWYDKRWFYEPSAGTPLLIRGPGVANVDVSAITSNVDLAPTILELAGLEPSADMQGTSLLPLARGGAMKTKPAYGHFYESDDSNHKAPKYVAIVTERYKIIYYYELNEWEIFDLKNDPNEAKNLWTTGLARQVRAELIRKLLARQRELKEDGSIIRLVEEAVRSAHRNS